MISDQKAKDKSKKCFLEENMREYFFILEVGTFLK
jgi:hypothetical protein